MTHEVVEIHIGDVAFNAADHAGQICVNQYLFADAISGSLVLARKVASSGTLEEAQAHALEAEKEWHRVLGALKLPGA